MKFNDFIDSREVGNNPLQIAPGVAVPGIDGEPTMTNKMTRTTSGLRDVLLDEIDSLRNGETAEGRAHAVARLANAAISTVRLEMDAHEFLARNAEPAKSIATSIRPLTLAA